MESVKNAADEDQVKKAGKDSKTAREIEVADLKSLLTDVRFRKFMWRVLGYTQMFKSPLDNNGSMQYYKIGQGDVGRFLVSEISDADSSAFVKMMGEVHK